MTGATAVLHTCLLGVSRDKFDFRLLPVTTRVNKYRVPGRPVTKFFTITPYICSVMQECLQGFWRVDCW